MLNAPELRLDLEAVWGVSASPSTIWRALAEAGYTTKEVCSTRRH